MAGSTPHKATGAFRPLASTVTWPVLGALRHRGVATGPNSGSETAPIAQTAHPSPIDKGTTVRSRSLAVWLAFSYEYASLSFFRSRSSAFDTDRKSCG